MHAPRASVMQIWGEDLLLNCDALKDPEAAFSLTHVATYNLRKRPLLDILDNYPRTRRKFRRASVRYATFVAHRSAVSVLDSLESGCPSEAQRYDFFF